MVFIFLLIHILVTFLSKIDGCPRGYIGVGGISDYGMYPNCVGGVAKYLDVKMFGENHIL